MNMFRLLICAALASAFMMTGCKKEETAGDKVDNAIKAGADAAKKGADAAGDAAKKGADALKDATK